MIEGNHKTRKIGFVMLSFANGKWRARYKDKAGADVRRVLPVADESEAVELARQYNREILGDRDAVPTWKPRKSHEGMTVRDGLMKALKASGAHSAGHTINSVRGCNRFLEFMGRVYPDIVEWAELKPSVLKAWVCELQSASLAFDSIRLLLAPTRQASKFWALELPESFRDWTAAARIRLQKPIPKQPPVLNAGRLTAFLDWLAVNAKRLYPLGVLQGMAGLREYEAANVCVGDLDLRSGYVTVGKTALHAPKNRASYRRIPLGRLACARLTSALHAMAVINASSEEPLFLNDRHRPFGTSALESGWTRTMRRARSALDLPEGFTAHHLRASFVSLAYAGGADSRSLKTYVGHAAPDILGAHYLSLSDSDMRSVVACFDKAVDNQNQPANDGFSGRILAVAR
ncbi:MAG: tyrosine-type recombinase/integrase [Candidatus Sumerlaeota bacterium]|nr:tyrosine-type recombinase/integrase [Candidatus Sumerlaeota bacterium]